MDVDKSPTFYPFAPPVGHRRRMRLKGYDYSQAGAYFVTMCCQNRECLFGEITNDKMNLNDAGKMVEKWCVELSHKFSNAAVDPYVIMPNHFHAVIINRGANPVVGAGLCAHPFTHHAGNGYDEQKGGCYGQKGGHVGPPLHTVVHWFKTMTTNGYIRGVKTFGWKRFCKKLWQRSYYEHIIRSEQSYTRIADYITNNTKNWKMDRFYMDNGAGAGVTENRAGT